MTQARNGHRVKVHYTGKLDDGTVFDSTEGRDPLEFTLGEGHVISGFEIAVEGMDEGDSKTVTLPPEQAYGPHREEMVVAIDRQQVPTNFHPQVGQQVELRSDDGRTLTARVIEVDDVQVTIDANHPLAGQQLVFDIDLVAVR
jgi:peptidylprolyl isomerase